MRTNIKRRPAIGLILALAAIAMFTLFPAAAFAHMAGPGDLQGPLGGVFWAHDVAYISAVTSGHVPDVGPFYAFYVFPNWSDCVPVSGSALGDTDYNGGRWAVIQAFGIGSQLTNAEDVVAAATSLVDTGHRFVCPLIKISGSD